MKRTQWLSVLLLVLALVVSACGAGGGGGTTTTTSSGTDTTPPVISNPQPSGTQPAGTTSVIMLVTTNENATCRYATTASTAYNSMTNTFTTTGGTAHSTQITGLSNGQTYNRYVRCRDTAGNANASSTTVNWSVAQAGTGTATLTWIAPTLDVNGGALTELTGYKVFYCTSTTGQCNNYNATPIATVPHPTLTYTGAGLAIAYHCYDVKAYNSGDDSPSACGTGNYCCKQIP